MTRAHGVRIGVKLGQGSPIETYRAVWRLAEEAGFDHCWSMDHLISFGPGGAGGDIFEGWALLAAMAVATSRLRMGLLVTAATFRHPAQLAKQAVTIDHLSGGRLEFGIGAGWAVEEHRMFGIGGLAHRVGLLSEALQVVQLLWSEPRADFSGRYFRLQGAVAEPKPVQRPHPPIWIGASGPAMLRVAARHADVWSPPGNTGLSIAGEVELSRRLDEVCAEAGRDPAEVRRCAQVHFAGGDPAPLLDALGSYRTAGFRELVVILGGPDPLRAAAAAAAALTGR